MNSIIAGIATVIIFLIICFVGVGSTYFLFIDRLKEGEGDERNTR